MGRPSTVSTEGWLFLFGAIQAAGVLAVFFRVDVRVIRKLMRRSKTEGAQMNAPTGREKLMAALATISLLLCGAGFIVSNKDDNHYYILSHGPAGPGYIIPGNPDSLQGSMSSEIKVDGQLLKRYQKNYKIMAVCFHHLKRGDVLDEDNLSKSGLYDIEPRQITMSTPWTRKFIEEMAAGWQQTGYELLAIPPGVTPEQFGTLRQAVALEALRLQRVGGPP